MLYHLETLLLFALSKGQILSLLLDKVLHIILLHSHFNSTILLILWEETVYFAITAKEMATQWTSASSYKGKEEICLLLTKEEGLLL